VVPVLYLPNHQDVADHHLPRPVSAGEVLLQPVAVGAPIFAQPNGTKTWFNPVAAALTVPAATRVRLQVADSAIALMREVRSLKVKGLILQGEAWVPFAAATHPLMRSKAFQARRVVGDERRALERAWADIQFVHFLAPYVHPPQLGFRRLLKVVPELELVPLPAGTQAWVTTPEDEQSKLDGQLVGECLRGTVTVSPASLPVKPAAMVRPQWDPLLFFERKPIEDYSAVELTRGLPLFREAAAEDGLRVRYVDAGTLSTEGKKDCLRAAAADPRVKLIYVGPEAFLEVDWLRDFGREADQVIVWAAGPVSDRLRDAPCWTPVLEGTRALAGVAVWTNAPRGQLLYGAFTTLATSAQSYNVTGRALAVVLRAVYDQCSLPIALDLLDQAEDADPRSSQTEVARAPPSSEQVVHIRTAFSQFKPLPESAGVGDHERALAALMSPAARTHWAMVMLVHEGSGMIAASYGAKGGFKGRCLFPLLRWGGSGDVREAAANSLHRVAQVEVSASELMVVRVVHKLSILALPMPSMTLPAPGPDYSDHLQPRCKIQHKHFVWVLPDLIAEPSLKAFAVEAARRITEVEGPRSAPSKVSQRRALVVRRHVWEQAAAARQARVEHEVQTSDAYHQGAASQSLWVALALAQEEEPWARAAKKGLADRRKSHPDDPDAGHLDAAETRRWSGDPQARAAAIDFEVEFSTDGLGMMLLRKDPPEARGSRPLYVPEAKYSGPPCPELNPKNRPISWRTFFLLDAHRHHESIEAMKAYLNGFVWWPTMSDSIAKVHGYCMACAATQKHLTVSAFLRSTPIPIVFAKLAWDLVDITPEGADGEQGFVVIVDEFSQYVWLKPYFHKEAREIAWALFESILDAGVVPWIVRSDLGGEFRNAVMMELGHFLGLKQVFGTALHSRAHGKVERVIREVIRRVTLTLWELVKERKNEWPKWATFTQHYLRHRPLRACTEVTPFAMTRGFFGTSPLKSALKQLRETPVHLSHDTWIRAIVTGCRDICFAFERAEATYKDGVRLKANVTIRPTHFQVGDLVLLKMASKEAAPSAYIKLSARATGPYRIDEVKANPGQPAHAARLTEADSGRALLDRFHGQKVFVSTERLVRFAFPRAVIAARAAELAASMADSAQRIAAGDYIAYYVPECDDGSVTIGRVLRCEGTGPDKQLLVEQWRLQTRTVGEWITRPWCPSRHPVRGLVTQQIAFDSVVGVVTLSDGHVLTESSVDAIRALGLMGGGIVG
jgi:hypothetical protein